MRLAAPPNTMYFPPPPKKNSILPHPPKNDPPPKIFFCNPSQKIPPPQVIVLYPSQYPLPNKLLALHSATKPPSHPHCRDGHPCCGGGSPGPLRETPTSSTPHFFGGAGRVRGGHDMDPGAPLQRGPPKLYLNAPPPKKFSPQLLFAFKTPPTLPPPPSNLFPDIFFLLSQH